jgi:hypothetical protein
MASDWRFPYYTKPRDPAALRRDCLSSVRQWPGCETVKDVSLLRDGDGKYVFAVTDFGVAERKAANRAVKAFQNEVRRLYHYDAGNGEFGPIAPVKR